MSHTMRFFLEAQAATLQECRAVGGAEPLPLRAVFQPVRVRQTWPTRPRSDRAGHAAETRELPTIARGPDDRRFRTPEYDWARVRGEVTERPILLLGEAGRGKSTLLAWECLERTATFLDGTAVPSHGAAKPPILLRASELLSREPTAEAEHGLATVPSVSRETVLARIATVAARRATRATRAQHTALHGEIIAALMHGRASLLLDDDATSRDATLAAPLAAALRTVAAVHAELEIVVATRFADATAYDLRPRIWRVFEIVDWRTWDIEAFVERVLELRRTPAPARRAVRTLQDHPPIARMMEIPRALTLLCDAAIAAPTMPPALLARQVVRQVLAAELDSDDASPQVLREVEVLERIAYAWHCVADDGAHDVAPEAPHAALRAGLVEAARGPARSPLVLQRGLDAALAAVALARHPAEVPDPLPRLRTSSQWRNIAVLTVGALAATAGARAEQLLHWLLSDDAAPRGLDALSVVARCAAQIPDPSPDLLRRLVARMLEACTRVANGDDVGHGIEILVGGRTRKHMYHQPGLAMLGSMVGDTIRAFGGRVEVGPLRQRLVDMLASNDAATRCRGVTMLRGTVAYDGRFRRALIDLLRPEREGDEEVREAAIEALADGARHDPLLCEAMLRLLDARREPDLTVRGAAARIVAAAAPFDQRLGQELVAHLDPRVEPSAAVRYELLEALATARRTSDRFDPALLGCLVHDPDPDVRLRAACDLLLLDPDDRATALLLPRLEPEHEPNDAVRAATTSLLRRRAAQDDRVQRTLLRHLDRRRERSDEVRAGAAGALQFVAMTRPEVRQALIAATDPAVEPSDQVRGRAIMALSSCVDAHEDARLALSARLDARREPQHELRLRALSLLRDMMDDQTLLRPLLPPLLDPSTEPDWNVRRTAAEILGRAAHQDGAARQALLARLDVADDITPAAALRLAALAATDDVVRTRLLALVADANGSNQQTRACAVHALGHALEHAEVRASLLRHLGPWRERDTLVIRMAARALAPLATSDREIGTALLEMLRAQHPYHPSVRTTVATLLREHADPTPLLASMLDGIENDDLGEPITAMFLTFGCAACRP